MIRRLASVLMIWVVVFFLLANPTKAASPMIVALTFDDGTEDHFSIVKPIFAAHGLHGTFFINSGLLGTDGYMTWDQVLALAADGNEIGGHGLTHERLGSYQQARFEACQDRVNMFNHGLQPVSFAFPFGQSSAEAEQAVEDCGYNSARLGSGIGRKCGGNCSEPIPPPNLYGYRSISVLNGWGLSTLQQVVVNAEVKDPGRAGFLEIPLHRVGSGRKSFSSSDLSAFLGWLNARGTPVQTISQIIGGAVQLPVLP